MSVSASSGLLLAIAVASALPAWAQETVLLRLDPPAGQVTRQRMETKMWMLTGTAMPSDTSAPTITQLMFATTTVAADTGGLRAITTLIDSSRMEMDGSPFGAGVDLFKGTRTIRSVNADGDLVSSSVVPGPNLPPMMAGQMSGFGGTPGQHQLPKRPLRVGDVWTDSTPLETGAGQGRPVSSVVTQRLERIEQREGSPLATIAVKGTSVVPADSAHRISLSGDLAGEMIVDVSHRRIVRLTNETRTRIDSPNGPQTSLVRMTMTLIEP